MTKDYQLVLIVELIIPEIMLTKVRSVARMSIGLSVIRLGCKAAGLIQEGLMSKKRIWGM